jgi:hypothetical protein
VTVIGFTGHRELSSEQSDIVAAELRAALRVVEEPLVGVCSLSSGADQLFAGAVLESEGELFVVLPSRDFESTLGDSGSAAAYRRILPLATSVETLDFDTASNEAYLRLGQRVVDLSDTMLAVWDGLPARGMGGTADVVEYARGRGRDVLVIWPFASTENQR